MSQMNVSSELSPELNRKKFFEERITEVADSLRRDFEPEFRSLRLSESSHWKIESGTTEEATWQEA